MKMFALIMCPKMNDEGVVALVKTTPKMGFIALTGTSCTEASLLAIAEHCPALFKIGVPIEGTTDAGILALARNCPKLKCIATERGKAGWAWGKGCPLVTEEGKREAEKIRPGIFDG